MKIINNIFFKKPVVILCLLTVLSLGQNKLIGQDTDDEFGKTESFDEKLERTKKLIVMLRVDVEGSNVIGTGIIAGRGKNELLIVTAYHLLHRGTIQASNIKIEFRARPGKFFDATIVNHGNEEEMDWALLSVKNLSAAGIDVCSINFDRAGNASALSRGDPVFPIGNPNGIKWAVPVASDKISDIPGNDIVFQSAFISNGNSGGALLDSNAQIIGMVIKDQPPFGRAIKIDTLLSTVPIYCLLHPDYGWTKYSLLHIVANQGDIKWIKYLLTDKCFNINVRDKAGRTPLHYTAGATSDALFEDAGFSLEAMKILVSSGADINALDEYNNSALDYAAETGKSEQLKFLLKSGAPVNGTSKKVSPLIGAVVNRKPETVALLISAHANTEKSDEEGLTPLFHSIEYWDGTIAQMLIRAGANVNAKLPTGETPLHLAAKKSNEEAIKLLIKAGAKVNAPNNEGQTPLHYAILNDSRETDYLERFKILLDAGADLNAADKDGQTPVDCLKRAPYSYRYDLIDELFKKYKHK